MAKITIDCADPNDFTSIIELAEQAAGRCNITYAKTAAALVDAGTVRSERQAAKRIAEETGESVNTVRSMIQRGKSEMDASASKKKPAPADKPNRPMATEAMQFAVIVISQLERIRKDDPQRTDAIRKVGKWIQHHFDGFLFTWYDPDRFHRGDVIGDVITSMLKAHTWESKDVQKTALTRLRDWADEQLQVIGEGE